MSTTLEVLGSMPKVTGSELDNLLTNFSNSVEVTLANAEQSKVYTVLSEFNPLFKYSSYSVDPRADLLANIVSGIYAPLLHSFAHSILKNIAAGNLPPVVVAPPRDAIPIVTALKSQVDAYGLDISILQPAVTRKVAGVHNNQNGNDEYQDPLLGEYLAQTFQPYMQNGYVEVETGIYGTTSLVMANFAKRLGMVGPITSLKWYALGPNMSYAHHLLSTDGEWIAEYAEQKEVVNVNHLATLMVLLDSMEEFGMQNWFKSIAALEHSQTGQVVPVIHNVDAETLEIAVATNKAITSTASTYDATKSVEISLTLLNSISGLLSKTNELKIPLMLGCAVPPMDNHEEHFQRVRTSGVFSYPQLI